MQDWWHFFEADKLNCILLSMLRCLILILSIQFLLRHILPETVLDGLVALYVELEIYELLSSCRFVLNIDALTNILYLALKKRLESTLY